MPIFGVLLLANSRDTLPIGLLQIRYYFSNSGDTTSHSLIISNLADAFWTTASVQDFLRYLSAVVSGYQERFDLRMAFDFVGT
jgi:hypothetical protein